MSPPRHHNALPEGYHLHWYEIDSILGQGGFGITYLARDTNLDQPVAIKEFLPSDLAARTEDSTVHPLSAGHSDTYGWGLNRFLSEARTLAKFRHPNIVRVMSVFEANNTAYMVMEYERGESFENMLKFKQIGGEQALKTMLLPLLDGLELVHDAGFIHRDIKPSNIYLREDGVPVLLDFGSARLALGVETRTLTSLVSPGYAPFEQYNATRESDKQGPWTDIYALGATLYRAVTGQGPIDAAARANLLLDEGRDPFQPCAHMGLADYSPEFLLAIDRALAFPPSDRPQSVAAWRQLVLAGAVDPEAETVAVGRDAAPVAEVDFPLDGGDQVTAPATSATRTVPMAELEAASGNVPAARPSGRGWFIATSVVAVIGIAAVAWLTLAPRARQPTPMAVAGEPAEPNRPASAPPTQTPPEPTPGDAVTASAQSAASPAPPVLPVTSAEVRVPEPTAAGSHAAATTVPRPAPAHVIPPAKAPASATGTAERVAQKPAAPAPAPAPAPKKTPPKTLAKAAPAKSAATTAPPATKSSASKRPKPRTRDEKVAALLATADSHMRANRLTEPKKSNALRDYLTVLAMDTDNDPAHRGVERIVERYVAMANQATGDGQYDKADVYLRQARFVLDAMELRKWPRANYKALFGDYIAATRTLSAAR